jgi:hypothetical protein
MEMTYCPGKELDKEWLWPDRSRNSSVVYCLPPLMSQEWRCQSKRPTDLSRRI